jgi:hypothetical protein
MIPTIRTNLVAERFRLLVCTSADSLCSPVFLTARCRFVEAIGSCENERLKASFSADVGGVALEF